jgi:hypothetical protein
MTDFITFNHNGGDGPDWDDAVRGYLLEAADHVDRGQIKMALRLVKQAEQLLDEREEDGMTNTWKIVNGVTYIAWPEQAAFVEQGRSPEDVGALYAPMNADGTMDTANVGEIEVPYSEA